MKIFAVKNNTLPISVCNYLNGNDSAVIHTTDKSQEEKFAMELFAFRHNFRLTTFDNNVNVPFYQDIFHESGSVDFDCYFPTDFMFSDITDSVIQIPDYYSTTWTNSGKAYFPNVVVGTTKPNRYPNHGQQLYDVSGGKYGYDLVNSTYGSNNGNEISKLVEYLQDYFISKIGRKARTLSFRNGQSGGAGMLVPYFLGGRNSNAPTSLSQNGYSDYGKNNGSFLGIPQRETSRQLRLNQNCTMRFKDMYEVMGVGTEVQIIQKMKDQMSLCISNNGAFNDFIHRYQWIGADRLKFDNLLNELNLTIGSSKVWRCSYGDALSYLFIRELVKGVTAFTDNEKVRIIVAKIDYFPEKLDLELLKDGYISVEIDLSTSSLAGKNIISNNGKIISLGADKYIINLPFGNMQEGFITAEIEEGSPDYLNLSRPVISGLNKSGNTISFTTNIPCKSVAFYYSDFEYNAVNVLRNYELKTSHNIDISELTAMKFKIGVISEANQMNLSSEL